MARERIEHNKGGYIIVERQGSGWKALVYPPGATRCDTHIPHGPERDLVIFEAEKMLDEFP